MSLDNFRFEAKHDNSTASPLHLAQLNLDFFVFLSIITTGIYSRGDCYANVAKWQVISKSQYCFLFEL